MLVRELYHEYDRRAESLDFGNPKGLSPESQEIRTNIFSAVRATRPDGSLDTLRSFRGQLRAARRYHVRCTLQFDQLSPDQQAVIRRIIQTPHGAPDGAWTPRTLRGGVTRTVSAQ